MENFLKDLLYKMKIYKIGKKYLLKPYNKFVGLKFNLSAKTAIKNFIKVMEKHNYNYWLEFGTLLGAVREKGFISHDFDIDVAMSIDDYDQNLEKKLSKYGFKMIKRATLLSGEIIEETYKYKTAKIDIFYAYNQQDKTILYDYQTMNNLSPNECIKQYGGLRVYRNVISKFDLIAYEYLDGYVKVPSNYQVHLEELYGEDYMIKNKNWSINFRSVREQTDQLTKVEYF